MLSLRGRRAEASKNLDCFAALAVTKLNTPFHFISKESTMKIQKTLVALSLGCLLSFTAFADDKVPADAISFSKLLSSLHNAGYNVVLKVEFDDGVYKANVIDPQGRQIKVSIEPTSGEVIKPKSETNQLSMMDAVKKVENAGYHNFYKITSGHDKYEIKALDKDNKKVAIEVDTKTGKISKDMF
jgi:hypothetical protein